MAQTLIQVKDLKKYYNGGDVKALDGVTVDVYKGDVIAVIGPSGGGKSTFLRSLNLLETPTSGSIIFDGVDITGKKVDLPLHRQKMGMVFQHFNLFPNRTVLENLTMAPIRIKKTPKAEAEAIRQKGLAEAEAMKQKAEAYKQYNDAAVAEMMIKVLPEIARSVAQPLSSIDKVSIIGGDASGVSGVSGNVPVLMAQTMEAMKEATGIDMRDIVRANSIEAKTDRNITIKTEGEE